MLAPMAGITNRAFRWPRSVQLYGVDPVTVANAVRLLVAEDRADHVDLNFGCPVPKAVSYTHLTLPTNREV